MRLLGQLETCLLFYEKILSAQKRRSSQSQLTKQKEASKNNTGDNFSRMQTSNREKLFILRFLKNV